MDGRRPTQTPAGVWEGKGGRERGERRDLGEGRGRGRPVTVHSLTEYKNVAYKNLSHPEYKNLVETSQCAHVPPPAAFRPAFAFAVARVVQ